MRPLRYSLNLTLDGCYDHEAIVPDESLHHHAAALIREADAMIFGRVTYGMMETAWRPVAETGLRPDWMPAWMEPFAHTIHATKKYVVSTTLGQIDWNAELIRGDLGKKILDLKQEPGRGLCVAGVQLAQALTELGLIDEYEFIVHPRVAGHGPTLFSGLTKPLDLKLKQRSELDSGAVVLRYDLRR